MTLVPTRQAMIDGRPLAVFDNLMPLAEVAGLYQSLSGAPFVRSEVARPDTQAFRHWAWAISNEDCRQQRLYSLAMRAIAAQFSTRGPQRLYRAYCNLSTYGDMLFTHTDAQPGEEEMTALWYIVPRWDLDWGGETLFFNAAGDAEFVVSPRPGRLVVFDGRIRHAGRPPSRICTLPRLSFALKFECAEPGANRAES